MKMPLGIFYGKKWNDIIAEVSSAQGSKKAYGEKFYVNADGRFNQIIDQWKTAGYDKTDTVEWINFYPEKDFSKQVVNDFEEFTRTKCARSWISSIRPGKMAPWHNDVDDQEEEYLKLGELVRYTCHMSEPDYGQVFVLGSETFYFEQQGSTYQWPDYKEWHAGGNFGFAKKYLFNFLGYKR